MPSATDFLPSYIRLFMNFARIMSPNLASGMTSRFSARWRRDMSACFLVPLDQRGLFRTLCAIDGPALLAVFDTLCVQHPAKDVITHAGQVFDAAAADQYDGMFLQVVALARNVTHDFIAIGQAHFRDLAQRRVRLFRRRRIDARTHAALLRTVGQRRHLVASRLLRTRLSDQLVDCRHLSLSPCGSNPNNFQKQMADSPLRPPARRVGSGR